MHKNKAQIAKVTRPVITETYQRKRLFHLLDQCTDRPVIWISGPAGSGKTTLISSYIDMRKLPCLWYRLDEGDADPASFFYYMGVAGKIAAPRKRKPLPLLTPEYLPGLPTFAKRYFENLYDRINPFAVVVFDNYQDVPGEAGFNNVMCNGLLVIPEGIRVIIISRKDPPEEFMRLCANRGMNIIEWNELRLTIDETKGIMQLFREKRPSTELIYRINERLQGWIAGIVLLLERTKGEDIESLLNSGHTPQEIFEYFSGEIFERTDKSIKEFLLKTAFLQEITSKIANQLTDTHHADRILLAQYSEHFFTERSLLHSETVYRYHPLYREFLISRAKEYFEHAELLQIQRKAAHLMENKGQLEGAAELYIQTGDVENLIPFILKNALILMRQGRGQTLERWLRSIPNDVLENTPWLLFWIGMCRLPFDQPESREYLKKGFKLFHEQKDSAGVFLSWSGIIQSIIYGFENFKLLDMWISNLGELIRELEGIPPGEIEMRVASCMFSALVLRQPGHTDFDMWKERALELCNKSPDINLRVQTYFELLFYSSYKGDISTVITTAEQLKSLALSKDIEPITLLTIKLAEAYFNFCFVRKKECLKAVENGLKLARETGVHAYDIAFMTSALLISDLTGDRETAKIYFGEIEQMSGMMRPWDAAIYYHHKSIEALEAGDLNIALDHAKRALGLCQNVGELKTECLIHMVNALVKCELGKYEEAIKHISAVKTEPGDFKGIKFPRLLVESYIALRQGKEQQALENFSRAMAVGREISFILLICSSRIMTLLCLKALEAGVEVECTKELIRRHNFIPDTPPLHIEDWPWMVRIYTLGRFDLVIDGRPLKFSRKAQKKPLEMLKALIAFGGRDVSEHKLADALWPEADADIAHKSFATTLHRLRKLLVNEEIIQLREGRVTLDNRNCWVDVWAYERILGEVESVWKKEHSDENINHIEALTERAMSIYKGHFLHGDDYSWPVSLRERLRSKTVRHVRRLGNYRERTGEYDEAAECYNKAIETDNLAEEYYQHLMTCYQKLGRKAEALAVYNRCQKTFSSVFGIEPSAETKRIYREIMK